MKIFEVLAEAADPILTKDSVFAFLNKDGLIKGPESYVIKGNKIFLLTNGDRKQALNDTLLAVKKITPQANPQIMSDPTSSIGVIGFPGSSIKVGIKSSEQQGDKSAGVANELELAKIIQGVAHDVQY